MRKSSIYERAAALAEAAKERTDITDSREFEGLEKDEMNRLLTLWFKRYIVGNLKGAVNFEVIMESDAFTEEEKDLLIFNIDDFKVAAEKYKEEIDELLPRMTEDQRDVYSRTMMEVIYGKENGMVDLVTNNTLKPKTTFYNGNVNEEYKDKGFNL
jgi:hypothetical protein